MSRMSVPSGDSRGVPTPSPKKRIIGMSTRKLSTPPAKVMPATRGPMM